MIAEAAAPAKNIDALRHPLESGITELKTEVVDIGEGVEGWTVWIAIPSIVVNGERRTLTSGESVYFQTRSDL